MLRLLHTSGLSLGAPLTAFGLQAGARREDFFHTFERLLAAARREQVEVFLVAGGLFATPRPERDCLQRVQAGLKTLAEAGILPVLLPGAGENGLTADAVYRRDELPGIILPAKGGIREIEVGGQLLRFVVAGPAHPAPVPGAIDIGVAADDGAGALGGSFDAGWQPAYLALGGSGEFQLLERDGVVLGCRPGTPEGCAFTEAGPRFAALVEVGAEGCRVEALPTESRQLLVRCVELSGGEEEGELLALVRQALEPRAAVQVTLTGPVEQPLELAALREAAGGDCFFLELVDRTCLAASRLVQRLAEEDTVRGLCLRRFLERFGAAGEGEGELLEGALREILCRLQVFPGGGE
jgi:hypothetical protein